METLNGKILTKCMRVMTFEEREEGNQQDGTICDITFFCILPHLKILMELQQFFHHYLFLQI
jgi:hypothetical protein